MRRATNESVAALLAANLKQLRRRARLTQAQAAERWQAKRTTYAAWEEQRAGPKLAGLLAGCQAFDVTLHQLLTTKL